MKISAKAPGFIDALWIFLTFLLSGHPFQTIFPYMSYLAFAMIALLIITKKPSFQNIGTPKTALGVFTLMILLTMIACLGEGFFAYINMLSFICLAFLMVCAWPNEIIIHYLQKTMTFVSVFAIIGWALVNYTSVLNSLPKIVNSNGVEYGIGIVFNYITGSPTRNCGIFWEPGIFASALAIAIVFELFLVLEKPKPARLILYFVSLFTCQSSAGYILLIFCAALLFTRRINYKTNIRFFWKILACVLVIGIFFVAMNLDTIILTTSLKNNDYLVKLVSKNLVESARVTAFQHNLDVFAEFPIFGAGLSEVARRMVYCGDIATSAYVLSIFGVLGASYTLFWIYGIFSQKRMDFFSKLIVTIMILLILNKEPHLSILSTWLLLFLFLKDNHLFGINDPNTQSGAYGESATGATEKN